MGEAVAIKELTDCWGRGGRSYLFNSTQLDNKFLKLSTCQHSRAQTCLSFSKSTHEHPSLATNTPADWKDQLLLDWFQLGYDYLQRKQRGFYQSQPKVLVCKTWFHPTVKFDFQRAPFFFLYSFFWAAGGGEEPLWSNYLLKSADLKNNITSQVIPFIAWFDSSGKAKQKHNALQPQQLGWKLLQIVRRSCKLEIGSEEVRNDRVKKKKKGDKLLQRPYSLNRWSKTCLFDLFVCLLKKCYFGILETQSVNFSASALSWLLRAV